MDKCNDYPLAHRNKDSPQGTTTLTSYDLGKPANHFAQPSTEGSIERSNFRKTYFVIIAPE